MAGTNNQNTQQPKNVPITISGYSQAVQDMMRAKHPPTTRRMTLPYFDSSRMPSMTVNHSAVAARMPVSPFQNNIIALFIVFCLLYPHFLLLLNMASAFLI